MIQKNPFPAEDFSLLVTYIQGLLPAHTDLLIEHFLTDSLNSPISRDGTLKAAILQLVSALPFLTGRTFLPVSFLCLSISESDGMLPNVSFHMAAYQST